MSSDNGRTGRFLGIPYDFSKPTWRKIKGRIWNPDSDRIVAPHVFGWGYTLNLHALLRRLRGLISR